MDPAIAAQLTALFGVRAASAIGAFAVLVMLIAHGVMPWIPIATAASPPWYRAAYDLLRILSGNYGNAAPAPPHS